MSKSPAWQALVFVEEMFGYFAPARHGAQNPRAIDALNQMYAYYTRR